MEIIRIMFPKEVIMMAHKIHVTTILLILIAVNIVRGQDANRLQAEQIFSEDGPVEVIGKFLNKEKIPLNHCVFIGLIFSDDPKQGKIIIIYKMYEYKKTGGMVPDREFKKFRTVYSKPVQMRVVRADSSRRAVETFIEKPINVASSAKVTPKRSRFQAMEGLHDEVSCVFFARLEHEEISHGNMIGASISGSRKYIENNGFISHVNNYIENMFEGKDK